MKQTAVEWFATELEKLDEGIVLSKKAAKRITEIIEQAKQKENYQIGHAFNIGDMTGRAAIVREIAPNDEVVAKYPEIDAEQYYNETYSK